MVRTSPEDYDGLRRMDPSGHAVAESLPNTDTSRCFLRLGHLTVAAFLRSKTDLSWGKGTSSPGDESPHAEGGRSEGNQVPIHPKQLNFNSNPNHNWLIGEWQDDHGAMDNR